MKFNRVDLIARIDEAIERVTKETEAINKDLEKGYDKARDEWVLKMMPAWTEFGRTIIKRATDKQSITKEDCPPSIYKYGDMKFFQGGEHFEKREPSIDRLVSLKTALSATLDESITTRDLSDIGFKDINSLFRSGR